MPRQATDQRQYHDGVFGLPVAIGLPAFVSVEIEKQLVGTQRLPHQCVQVSGDIFWSTK
jgi:hypothetical protein